MTKLNKLIAGIGLLGVFGGVVGSAQAALVLDEGFNSFLPASWVATNNSVPIGSIGWFKGNDAVFPAQAGPVDSYAAANFNSAAPGGDISDWLLTPEVPLTDGYVFSFYTRTEELSLFPDRLEVRASTNGASTNVGATAASVGDFTHLLLTVNPALSLGGYPEAWTQFSVTVSGVGGSVVQGRLAFRYNVTDTNNNGDYIGVDTVKLDSAGRAVPEPSMLLMIALGLAVLPWHLRRGRAR